MDTYQIPNAPPSMFYISNFLSAEEEQNILEKIPGHRWITLSHRRLQAVPARLSASDTLLAAPLPDWVARPMGERFGTLGMFSGAPHGGANHCLINEYVPGQGIMPHTDGAAYHPVVATVSLGGTVVLDVSARGEAGGRAGESDGGGERPGSSSSSSSPPPNAWRIVQEARSLLVTTGSAYVDFLHGIAEVTEDVGLGAATVANWSMLDAETAARIAADGGRNERTKRISLTYRDVKKVSTIGTKIFGKGRS